MKNVKTKAIEKEPTETIVERTTDKSAALKKKKKTKQIDEMPTAATKVKKVKAEKEKKEKIEPKNQKAPKDDKLTKFLVSMKKSVRKSIKKEAAEAGVSMNEYIVLAVEDKLGLDSSKSVK
jgi:predicted HicB family RNase H-like nuclease